MWFLNLLIYIYSWAVSQHSLSSAPPPLVRHGSAGQLVTPTFAVPSLLWILRFWVRLTDLTKDQVVNFPMLPQLLANPPPPSTVVQASERCWQVQSKRPKRNGQRISETTKVKHVSFKCCQLDRIVYFLTSCYMLQMVG